MEYKECDDYVSEFSRKCCAYVDVDEPPDVSARSDDPDEDKSCPEQGGSQSMLQGFNPQPTGRGIEDATNVPSG